MTAPASSPDPEEVRRLLSDEGLTASAVSERYGYTLTGMHRFMRRHGIPTRPPGGGEPRTRDGEPTCQGSSGLPAIIPSLPASGNRG